MLLNNYKVYRANGLVPALVAWIAAKKSVQGVDRPMTQAWIDLDEKRLWVAKYSSKSLERGCLAIREFSAP